MMICGITTAPRPRGVSYLSQTVDSLLVSRPSEIHIFTEPDQEDTKSSIFSIEAVKNSPLKLWRYWSTPPKSPETVAAVDPVEYCKTEIHRNPQKLGNYWNWTTCARHVCNAATQQNNRYVLVSEDDCEYSPVALAMAEAIMNGLDENVGFLSLHCPNFYKNINKSQVCVYSPRPRCGAVSLFFRTTALRAILCSAVFEGWPASLTNIKSSDLSGIDTCISRSCEKLKLSHAVAPGLATHIGKISSLAKKGKQK